MKRRKFITSSILGSAAMAIGNIDAYGLSPVRKDGEIRKIFIYGGGLNRKFISYIAGLTGKPKPRICLLPTASADNPYSSIAWYSTCAGLDMVPLVQEMFISSYQMKVGFDEVLLSMDAIVVGGGNTLNMIAIWKAQGLDVILREAWNKGIILGGGSAGSLCWFEEGTTDSRPKNISKIECLGFLKGSHSPHYDSEPERRPMYQKLIADGELKPGWACDNNAGILFEGDEVSEVVATNNSSFAYWVDAVSGKAREKVRKPDRIL
jgi:peptidase E